MSYTAYEVATGNAEDYVEGLQVSYTENGEFTTETNPSLAVVEGHLTGVHADMAGMMVSNGYAAAQTDADVLALLMPFNARGAAYMIELGKVTSGFAPEGGQTRLSELAKWRDAFQDVLDTDTIELLGGVTLDTSSGDARLVTAGGVSLSDKLTRFQDSDFNPMKTEVDFSNRGDTSSDNVNLPPQ